MVIVGTGKALLLLQSKMPTNSVLINKTAPSINLLLFTQVTNTEIFILQSRLFDCTEKLI